MVLVCVGVMVVYSSICVLGFCLWLWCSVFMCDFYSFSCAVTHVDV